jgi:hypothetical protein
MGIDWVAISGAASAVASIVAVVSIVLAYNGVRVSREASALDRRTYLDGIFVRWLDSVDALDHAALPFLRHIPTQAELDSGAPDLPDAYKEFHLAFTHCQTAINLVSSTGMFDHQSKDAHQAMIATDELIEAFQGILWTYYFSVIRYSPAEAAGYEENQGLQQAWGSAIQEVESKLRDHSVPDKYFPLFEAKIKELYPESLPLSVWQGSDRLLDICKSELANQYQQLVDSRFPWDPTSRKMR